MHQGATRAPWTNKLEGLPGKAGSVERQGAIHLGVSRNPDAGTVCTVAVGGKKAPKKALTFSCSRQ